MYEVTNPISAPYASVCYIRCEWPDGTAYRGSGVIIGYNDVLTALHQVYQEELGGWASSITIIPGADTQPSLKPFGEFTNVGMLSARAADWDLDNDGLLTQNESAGDLALLGMTTRIGDITGWLPVAQNAGDFHGTMAGYPASGTGLMAEATFADSSATYGVYNTNSSLGPGASGGPLLQTVGATTVVTGVLSSGNASQTSSTYAGLFTADTWGWLQGAMTANDSLLPSSFPTSVALPDGVAFTGGANGDHLAGGSGRDFFTGNGGNDLIEGGANIDTAVYSGLRGHYNLTLGSGVSVSDQIAGRDGADSVFAVERFKFADMSLAFDVTGNAGQAYRLYQAAFDRTPDMAGLGYQMKALDDGLPLWLVASHFANSPEFARLYGSLNDQQFVTQLYDNVLHRAPDAQGYAYHTNNLANGFTRGDVMVGFSESPENQAALIGVMQNGMMYTV